MTYPFTQRKFFLFSAFFLTLAALSHAGDNKNVTEYKEKNKKKTVTPPARWVTPAKPQVIQSPSKDDDQKMRVTFVYDTLGNGKKEFVVGYMDKKTKEFEVDTTLSYRDPAQKPPPVRKPTPKTETRTVVNKTNEKFPASRGIHIAYSNVPTQSVSDYLNNYINNYNRNYGSKLRRIKSTKRKTISLIENILKRQGLPLQMKYLAVIESALNPKAVSPVGAVGMWQFMAPTARDMNLVVNEKVDQRTDVYKSTYAATKYMKHLHRIFGDWLLVIASYNSGPGPVLKAIRKTGSKNFWHIKNRLPSETRGHVMAFLATAAIMERLDNFSGLYKFKPQTLILEDAEDEKPQETLKRHFAPNEVGNLVILLVDKPLHSEVVCKRLQINAKDFERWNPQFDEMLSKKGANYNMYIPRKKMEGYSNMRLKITQESVSYRAEQSTAQNAQTIKENINRSNRKDNTANYIVQYGETIDMVSDRFGIPAEKLIELNHIKDFMIYPGDIIRVK